MAFRCKKHSQQLQKLLQISTGVEGSPALRTVEGPRQGNQIEGGWTLNTLGLPDGIFCQMCVQEGSMVPLDYDKIDIADAGLDDPPHVGLTAAEFSSNSAWQAVQKDFGHLIVATRERMPTSAITDSSLASDDRLDKSVRTALHNRILGGNDLWAHQAKAIDAALEGLDVVIETATASGKSLCYWVPILNAAVQDPQATALYIAPMNALAEDQMRAVEKFSEKEIPSYRPGTWQHYTRSVMLSNKEILVARYDGTTPIEVRGWIRKSTPRVIVTSPDLLHIGILPNHRRLWAQFFGNLRYIVLDELHVYRGMFGAHFANVLRRVLRLAKMYGQRPQIIACSASIGNPSELFKSILL